MGNCFCVAEKPVEEIAAFPTKAPSVVSTASAASSQEPVPSRLPPPVFTEFAYNGDGEGQESCSLCLNSLVRVVKGPQATVLVHPVTGRVLVSVQHQMCGKSFAVSTTDGRLVGHIVRKSKRIFVMNKYRAEVLQERKKLKLSVTSSVETLICEVESLLGELRLNGPVLKGADLIILSVFIAILL